MPSHPLRGAFVRVGIGLALMLVVVTQLQRRQTTPGFGPVQDQDYRNSGVADSNLVALGNLLFFDEELSGNRNISCATCHNPLLATTDGLSLSVGEGGNGTGLTRGVGFGKDRIPRRVARNAPALFNLGAQEFQSLFHDGRVAVDAREPSGFSTPAGNDLPSGLHSVLAAQALFPLVMEIEMAGQPGENEIADAADLGRFAGDGGAWDLLARRLGAIPSYAQMFSNTFEDIEHADDITIVHAANAIAAFVESAFRTDQSPFDRYLAGDEGALTPAQHRGMTAFYGNGGRCSRCHSGVFQTDQTFHSVGMPQIGPGTGGGSDGHDDYGRSNVTGNTSDHYRFRTPSLRNVALTGPWGHSGAYGSLEAMVRHYRDHGRVTNYDRTQTVLPTAPDFAGEDFVITSDPARAALVIASSEAQSLQLSQLSDGQIEDLVAFLQALTDPRARDLTDIIPEAVPSGRMTRLVAGPSL